MAVIELTTEIRAPRARCFDLSLSVDLHQASATGTDEQAVAGVTEGVMSLGDEVTWRAWHLGMWRHLTVRITAHDRPGHFRDSMVAGAFRRFDHDHFFEEGPGGVTVMRDVFDFESPFGPLGRLVDRVFLQGYMTRFLLERNAVLKRVAESEEWRRFLGDEGDPPGPPA